MLNDARVASLGFFKDNICTTRINNEKSLKSSSRSSVEDNISHVIQDQDCQTIESESRTKFAMLYKIRAYTRGRVEHEKLQYYSRSKLKNNRVRVEVENLPCYSRSRLRNTRVSVEDGNLPSFLGSRLRNTRVRVEDEELPCYLVFKIQTEKH